MKILKIFVLLCFISLCTACSSGTKLKYSNLVDRETRDRVEGALKRAGLKEEKIQSFFSAVDEYNNAVGKENLVQKMTTIDSGFPSFG